MFVRKEGGDFMEKVSLLGTAGAVADAQRDNVSFVLSAENPPLPDFHVLIECGGSAAHKLAKIGIAYERLEDIIITHTHIDHFYGLPGFIFSTKYRDQTRKSPLRIYCPEEARIMVGGLLDFFNLREESQFPIEIHGISLQENAHVLENEHVVITSTPVDHAPKVPTFGIKVVSKATGKSLVYSSDTTYSERLIRLAKGANMLFHECCGLAAPVIPSIHSSALQVGKVAGKSEIEKLILLHLDTVLNDEPEQLIAEAQQHFTGEIAVASDFDEFEL
jgi:ribonuclease BN (tRNA processing enzyme)